jgi:hypothetical protein
MFPKVGLLEETKGGGKEEWWRVNNNEIHHIYVGTRHNETENCWTIQGKGRKGLRKSSGGI